MLHNCSYSFIYIQVMRKSLFNFTRLFLKNCKRGTITNMLILIPMLLRYYCINCIEIRSAEIFFGSSY